MFCGVLSLAVGAVWYGPIFGKVWMKIIGVSAHDTEARKNLEKSAGPLYAVQFLLTIFQVYVLAYLIAAWPGTDGVKLALFIWAGFVLPIVAGGVMWNNDSAHKAWARFMIQAGYQLLMFVVYGYVLTVWP